MRRQAFFNFFSFPVAYLCEQVIILSTGKMYVYSEKQRQGKTCFKFTANEYLKELKADAGSTGMENKTSLGNSQLIVFSLNQDYHVNIRKRLERTKTIMIRCYFSLKVFPTCNPPAIPNVWLFLINNKFNITL